MISRVVPAAVLGAVAGELAINPLAAELAARGVDQPAVVAVVGLPALVGLVFAGFGLLYAPAARAVAQPKGRDQSRPGCACGARAYACADTSLAERIDRIAYPDLYGMAQERLEQYAALGRQR